MGPQHPAMHGVAAHPGARARPWCGDDPVMGYLHRSKKRSPRTCTSGYPDHGPHRLHEQHRHGYGHVLAVEKLGTEAAEGRRHSGAHERVRAHHEPHPSIGFLMLELGALILYAFRDARIQGIFEEPGSDVPTSASAGSKPTSRGDAGRCGSTSRAWSSASTTTS